MDVRSCRRVLRAAAALRDRSRSRGAVRRRVLADDRRAARARADGEVVSEATVKLRAGDSEERVISTREGNGPVNALDNALRAALVSTYPELVGLELVDYKVRILEGKQGTGAVTRVLIESADESGEHWTTIGVSPNIIDASFQALMDSIIYKLVKSGAPA